MGNIILSGAEIEEFLNSRGFKWFIQEMEVGLNVARSVCENSANRVKLLRAQGQLDFAKRAISLPEIYLEEMDSNQELEEELEDDS